MVRGDVAVICTCSDHDGMAETAKLFAPEVIDVYRECLGGKTGLEAWIDGFNQSLTDKVILWTTSTAHVLTQTHTNVGGGDT